MLLENVLMQDLIDRLTSSQEKIHPILVRL